jgi:hypothetical protein
MAIPKSKKKNYDLINHMEQFTDEKLKISLSIVFALTGLLVFTLTLNPHIGPGDSGTIVTASYLMGINHPPGYPLYTILGKIFTYLPFGSVGFRVNFMNSVMTVFASLLFLHTFFRVTRNTFASLLAAGLFCFAPCIWQYAITAEVFPLNNLLIAALFHYLVLFVQSGKKKYAYLGTLMFGLGMSNHHTILFFGFPFACLVLFKGKKELITPVELAKICGIFFIGLLPYLYLVIAPNVGHIESWGDTTNFDGFMTHILRKEYGTMSLKADLKGGSFLQGIVEYFKQLPFELLFIGPLVAFFGVFQSYRKKKLYDGLLTVSVVAFFFISLFFTCCLNSTLPINCITRLFTVFGKCH